MPDLAPHVGTTDFNGIDEDGLSASLVYWKPEVGDRVVLTDESLSVWAMVTKVVFSPQAYRYAKDGVPGSGEGQHDRWVILCKPDWDTKSE